MACRTLVRVPFLWFSQIHNFFFFSANNLHTEKRFLHDWSSMQMFNGFLILWLSFRSHLWHSFRLPIDPVTQSWFFICLFVWDTYQDSSKAWVYLTFPKASCKITWIVPPVSLPKPISSWIFTYHNIVGIPQLSYWYIFKSLKFSYVL